MFGIEALDRDLGDIHGGTILLRNEAGTDAESILAQAVAHHTRAGRPFRYLATDRPVARIRRALEAMGADMQKITFIDGHGGRTGHHEPGALVLDPAKAEHVAERIREVTADGDHAHMGLAIDSLSGIVNSAGEDRFMAAWPAMRRAIEGYGVALVRFTDIGTNDPVEKALRDFKNVVRLLAVQDRVLRHQYLSVDKAHGDSVARPRRRLVRIDPRHGAVVYIPKILVTGPFDAGKTTLIQSVSNKSVSTEFQGTTVAIDKGRIEEDGLVAELYGTPGQERFDPLLKVLANQAVGVILMVDSTRPDTFPRARDMLEAVWRQGLSVVVAANKQDLAGAASPEEIEKALEGAHAMHAFGCQARDPASAKRAVDNLIEQILYGDATAEAAA